MKLVSRDAEPRRRQRGSTDPVLLWCKCNISWLVLGTEYWKWITGQVLACRSISALFYAVWIACCFVMKADMNCFQVMVPEVTSSRCPSYWLIVLSPNVRRVFRLKSLTTGMFWLYWLLTLPLLCVDSHKVTATMGLKIIFLFVYFVLFSRPGGPQIFRKNDLKILVARKSTRNKFRAKDRQI